MNYIGYFESSSETKNILFVLLVLVLLVITRYTTIMGSYNVYLPLNGSQNFIF